MGVEEKIRKIYKFFRKWEHAIDMSVSFTIILAFITALPHLSELQFTWLVAFITLAFGFKIGVSRLVEAFPNLKMEEDKSELILELNDKIKKLERRIEKIERKKD